MRILLTSSASYDPPRGGSTRSNLVWLRDLASRGHACRVVSTNLATTDDLTLREGIEILRVHNLARRPAKLREAISSSDPDWVLVSSEDLSHMLLREAHAAAPDRLVYIAHTPQFYPFGPESWNPDAQASKIVRAARAVIAIGHHMAGYIERHLGVHAAVIHPPIYGPGPWPTFGAPDRGYVLMINPCAVKGISIFLALAERFPDLPFAALIGWGTTAADREALARHANVRVLEAVGNIDEVLKDTRVLLMPSLWYEGFGLIAMEAMLRGLPVIASDSGGLVEAKTGTGYVIPVRPIERYEPGFDENHMPRAVVSAQDVEPWAAALAELVNNTEAYEAEAHRSQRAAEAFVSGLRTDAFAHLLSGLAAPLRVLLAHNSLYFPSHGGGDVSNRLLMEALAARGHEVHVVSRVEKYNDEAQQRLLGELAARGVTVAEVNDGIVHFTLNGVRVHTAAANPQLRAYFTSQIESLDPDVIITSTDDPAQLLFEPAIRASRARVVHLVRATIAVPFGPDSSSPSPQRAEALYGADAVVGVSEYVARYVRNYGNRDAIHVPISFMPGRPPMLGGFANRYVTLVNPCAVKGIDIFLALAEQMPDVSFAAVPTWGTNAADLERLGEFPNIEVLKPVDDIDRLLRETKVLLVPSLWAEARSRIVVEAMARGVPVIASDIGGIPEAKLGVPYLVPVNPIRHYRSSVDENMVPVADVPSQNINAWRDVLSRLLTDRRHFEEISLQSRKAALEYIDALSVEPFERLLRRSIAMPRRVSAAPRTLTTERQRLLALRLRRRASSAWFPGIERVADGTRLFCFPHAGAGALHVREWSIPGVSVIPVLLPGRESRIRETPFDRMPELVMALNDAISPYLAGRFAFFGHSMGAAIAFELAHRVRVKPAVLIVSAAKAPQLRRNWQPPPEPPEAELLKELGRHEALPADPQLLQLILPALKADTRLYRNYVYEERRPLDIPICAYGGENDPNVRPEHLELWAVQTRRPFKLRLFSDGHFYLRQQQSEFLTALTADLEPPDSGS